jgi:hypothetical protein
VVVDWLVVSIVVSVVLTAALNLGLRAFPGAGERAARRLDRAMAADRDDDRRVHVWFPWKAMLVVSLGLTVLVNLAAWLL